MDPDLYTTIHNEVEELRYYSYNHQRHSTHRHPHSSTRAIPPHHNMIPWVSLVSLGRRPRQNQAEDTSTPLRSLGCSFCLLYSAS